MTLPNNEHSLEYAVQARYKRAGYWTRHMETSVPGFPDRMVAKGARSWFIEFKYVKPGDLDTPMLRHFQKTQPAQIQEMMSHGVRVQLVVYCGGIVYFCDMTEAKVREVIADSVRVFIGNCNSAFFGAYLESIE